MLLKPTYNYYLWTILAALNGAMVAIGLATDNWGRVGFSGFFLILSLAGMIVWSYLIDKDKNES